MSRKRRYERGLTKASFLTWLALRYVYVVIACSFLRRETTPEWWVT